jgi:hypothetical protein
MKPTLKTRRRLHGGNVSGYADSSFSLEVPTRVLPREQQEDLFECLRLFGESCDNEGNALGMSPADLIVDPHGDGNDSTNVPEAAFFLDGLMSNFPLGYLRTFCPRKSKLFSTCVMTVFAGESSSPRSCRNCSTRGLISPSSSSLDLPVMTKSSA